MKRIECLKFLHRNWAVFIGRVNKFVVIFLDIRSAVDAK